MHSLIFVENNNNFLPIQIHLSDGTLQIIIKRMFDFYFVFQQPILYCFNKGIKNQVRFGCNSNSINCYMCLLLLIAGINEK